MGLPVTKYSTIFKVRSVISISLVAKVAETKHRLGIRR
jgi:hypothetical protein